MGLWRRKNIENINLAWRHYIPKKHRNLRSRNLLLRPSATQIPHPTLRSRSSALYGFPVYMSDKLLFPVWWFPPSSIPYENKPFKINYVQKKSKNMP